MSFQIRAQADDFFNAYQVLNENSPVPCAPSVVCLAFAVELYIKDLYAAMEIKPPRSHNILNLYKGLPKKVQKDVFAHDAISGNPFNIRGDMFSPKYYNREYKPFDRFIDQVKAISNSFVEWRYPYQTGSASLRYDSSFVESLIIAVKSVSDTII